MAYIIAHGTVNGYQKIQSTLSDNKELQILTDIRTEFDNTASMLTKSEGYLLQMSPFGVWVSIVKTLMDGERSGGGAGFFAFSAFIPKEQMIAGQKLKNVLDKLMQHYLSLCPNFMTRNINVDWSFVTNASAELHALCQPRRKAINTCYVPSEQFAYVPITTNDELVLYLDKPFQPEYGAYKAVFLGMHLQHPMRLPQQTCLNIDLENEEYDIIWNGNVNGWNNLPQKVRKKEIASGSYTFKKDYYDSTTVSYLSGDRDDANTTLILDVPNLQPQINQITLQYNYPEAVVGVTTVPHLPLEQIKDPVLSFKGDEFAREWEVIPLICGDYKCEKISIIPSNCRNGICPVNIIKMQQISLQILENGENRTINYEKNIRISKSGKSIDASLNKVTSSLCLSIPESDDFIKEYAVSLINGTYYSLSNNLRAVQSGFYTINIQRKQNSQTINPEPVPQKRPVYLDCKIIDKIEVYYNGQPCKIINNRIEIPFAETRDNILVKIGDKKLKFKKVGNIYSPLFGCLSGGNTRLILIGIVATLMLLASVLLTLQFTKTIDIKTWFAQTKATEQNEDRGKEPTPPAIPPADTIPEEQRLYNELDNILKIQRINWNYKTITDLVGKYDTTKVIDKGHMAHPLYKELVWMKCRKSFDGYWYKSGEKRWILHKKHKIYNTDGLCDGWIFDIKKYGLNAKNKTYAYSEIYDFLHSIVKADDIKQKQFFEQYVTTRVVETMTFPDVKELWDHFRVENEDSGELSGYSNAAGNTTPPQQNAKMLDVMDVIGQ